MNTSVDLFLVFQKEVGNFLRKEGFRKVKTFYAKKMGDACCYFYLGKLRGYSDSHVTKFRAQCFLRFFALDDVFRPDVGENIDLTVSDVGHIFGSERSGVLELNLSGDFDGFLKAFRKDLEMVLQDFERRASLESFASSCLPQNGESMNVNHLLKGVVAAKISGRTDVYRDLVAVINGRGADLDSSTRFTFEKLERLRYL